MKNSILKLKFNTAVHFGEEGLNTCNLFLHSDTLFSALCLETLKIYGEEGLNKFVNIFKEGKLKISNALPIVNETMYLPKPIKRIENNNKIDKKIIKKLKYISIEIFEDYIKGNLKEEDVKQEVEEFSKEYGEFDIRTIANVRDFESTMPYNILTFNFKEKSGLYLIINYEKEDDLSMLKKLFIQLGYTGIGGKISSGLGKFKVEISDKEDVEELEKFLQLDEYKHKMLISTSLPKNEELEKAIDKAQYLLVKRAGFVNSDNYSENFLKKKELYAFSQGSCFNNYFEGDIYDVNINGKHPVYRYLKPIFIGVE